MESLLNRAFEALKSLPEVDRERIAWEIIERVEDKTEWDRIVAAPESRAWLEGEAKKALREYKKISSKISQILHIGAARQPAARRGLLEAFRRPSRVDQEARRKELSPMEGKFTQPGPAFQADPSRPADLLVPRWHAPPDGRGRDRRRQDRLVLGRLVREFREIDQTVKAGP